MTNADCESQQDSSLKAVLRDHENTKKLHYNRRVMEVEHGTFTPLVFTTTGVMGHECSIFHKALAEKISTKKNERYEDIMRYLRVKLISCSEGHIDVPARITNSEEECGSNCE